MNSKSFDYKANFIGGVTHNNLKKMMWNCCTIKIFEKFLEKLKYTTE